MRDKSLEESGAVRFVSPTGHTQVPVVTPGAAGTNGGLPAKPENAVACGPDRSLAGSGSEPGWPAGAARGPARRTGTPPDLPHFWVCASPCLRAAWAPPAFSAA